MLQHTQNPPTLSAVERVGCGLAPCHQATMPPSHQAPCHHTSTKQHSNHQSQCHHTSTKQQSNPATKQPRNQATKNIRFRAAAAGSKQQQHSAPRHQRHIHHTACSIQKTAFRARGHFASICGFPPSGLQANMVPLT